jgi:starch synthase (maltosyl-transferring)
MQDGDLSGLEDLRDYLDRVDTIRRNNPALQQNRTFRIHEVDNEQILCYSKISEDRSNIILVVVSLDYTYIQSGWVTLELESLGIDPHQPFEVHDLLDDARYLWNGPRNFVQLDPHRVAAHIFQLRPRIRTELDYPTYTV